MFCFCKTEAFVRPVALTYLRIDLRLIALVLLLSIVNLSMFSWKLSVLTENFAKLRTIFELCKSLWDF